ncbi:PepSY domain-containing protein [Isoptericola halotolerans]|uniref:PepSY-associated TM helix domain-containing protein n=1 Tax=Isoptericola halotolerans TaxID=300560 RepID=UPI00389085EB
MTHTLTDPTTRPPTDDGGPAPRRNRPWFGDLMRRLHFYAGLLVGPFILVAATSGALYALAPTFEQIVYDDELHAPATATTLSLGEQVAAAQRFAATDAIPTAVRPAPEPGDTTRVMFADDSLGSSETRGIFVDPGTGEVRGDLTVYGTSGSLPLRTWISNLHRTLHLGDAGRFYSELAASWLWIVALAGAAMWISRIRRTRRKKDMIRPNLKHTGYRRYLSMHTSLGTWVLLGALFLSATGMTWSQLAGANISSLRTAAGWETPALETDLGASPATSDGAHHDHDAAPAVPSDALSPAAFDSVYAIAQRVNIDAAPTEIKPPTESGSAWVVREIKRSYPTAGDSVAIDGTTLQVTDRSDVDTFPLMAKLSSWGIALHMGLMFGLPNQLVLVLLAAGIGAMVVLGYLMWWKRRPTREPRGLGGPAPRRGALRSAPWWGVAAVLAAAITIGLFIPLVGYTLAAFVLIDTVISVLKSRSDLTNQPAQQQEGRTRGSSPRVRPVAAHQQAEPE